MNWRNLRRALTLGVCFLDKGRFPHVDFCFPLTAQDILAKMVKAVMDTKFVGWRGPCISRGHGEA